MEPMERTFRWCPRDIASRCDIAVPEPHHHIAIRSPGAERQRMGCGGDVLHLEFHDLDPEAIRRHTAPIDPGVAEDMIARCMTPEQAREIARFVHDRRGFFLVNCEAGISRSAGVVVALRRFFGGDADEPFRRAHPNVHVVSMVWRVLDSETFTSPAGGA